MIDQTPVKRGRGRPRKVQAHISEGNNLHETGLVHEAITKGTDRRFHAYRKGWNDVIEGKPIDYNYIDSCKKWVAIAYENGRHRAISVIRCGLNPPAWNSLERIPPKITGAVNKAYVIAYMESMRVHGIHLPDYPLGIEQYWLPPVPEWNVNESSQPTVY